MQPRGEKKKGGKERESTIVVLETIKFQQWDRTAWGGGKGVSPNSGKKDFEPPLPFSKREKEGKNYEPP